MIAALRAALLRLGAFVATLLGVLVLVEGLLALAPGDAIDLLPNGDQVRPVLESEWGLNLPFYQRIWVQVGRILHGDLGTSLSYRPGAAVVQLVTAAGLQSLELLIPAVLLAVATGLGLAVFTAHRSGRWGAAVRVFSVVPAFLAAFFLVNGINAVTWAAIQRGWINRPEWFALPEGEGVVRWGLAVVILAYASGTLTEVHGACEGELRALLTSPFVLAERARGGEVVPVLARNLLPALASVLAGRTAALVGGLVVIEKLLLVNGAGAMLWEACKRRDFPVAVGVALGAAAVVCGVRLGTDLLRVGVDPRLRGRHAAR